MTSTIHPDTRIGAVALAVSDLERAVRFYSATLGLSELGAGSGGLWRTFGAGELPLVRLTQASGPALDPRLPGLYHMAILMPERFALARILYQLAEVNYPLQGASDHGVSEALYLVDPLGNGIELYTDRRQADWPRNDQGELDMVTAPLNLERLLFELKDRLQSWRGIDPQTRMGHVHLQVCEIPASEKFYTEVLGLEFQQRYGNSASFTSAGGYHHHVAFNTWNSRGSAAAPPDAAGLRYFELLLPDTAALAAVTDRIQAAGLPAEDLDGGLLVRDPSGNGILLKTGG